MTHRFACRVYYEDTDLAGIVYYANYLKFIERARSEWVRGLGIDQVRLRADTGVVFAVRRVEADYLRPARFDDLLEVATSVAAVGPALISLRQRVLRDGALLFDATVTLVALSASGRPVRLPEALRKAAETGLRGGGTGAQ
jgi:acyl-CoA thioester hydrolase